MSRYYVKSVYKYYSVLVFNFFLCSFLFYNLDFEFRPFLFCKFISILPFIFQDVSFYQNFPTIKNFKMI